MHISDFRSRVTPIPTPLPVRLVGAASVGGSLAAMVSQLPIGTKVLITLICVAVAIGSTLLHPYRAEMRAYAEKENVSQVPSISMLIPLMLWWLVLMLAPLASWPTWSTLLTGAIVTAVAWVLYPHVDGSRRLAYA